MDIIANILLPIYLSSHLLYYILSHWRRAAAAPARAPGGVCGREQVVVVVGEVPGAEDALGRDGGQGGQAAHDALVAADAARGQELSVGMYDGLRYSNRLVSCKLRYVPLVLSTIHPLALLKVSC